MKYSTWNCIELFPWGRVSFLREMRGWRWRWKDSRKWGFTGAKDAAAPFIPEIAKKTFEERKRYWVHITSHSKRHSRESESMYLQSHPRPNYHLQTLAQLKCAKRGVCPSKAAMRSHLLMTTCRYYTANLDSIHLAAMHQFFPFWKHEHYPLTVTITPRSTALHFIHKTFNDKLMR